jgi:hypothetical protein
VSGPIDHTETLTVSTCTTMLCINNVSQFRPKRGIFRACVIRTGNCLEMDNLQSENYNFEQNVACKNSSIRLLLRCRIRDRFYVVRYPRLLIVFCSGPFWYSQQLYFRLTLPSHISHGTYSIMTSMTLVGPKSIWTLRCLFLCESFSRPGLPNRRYPSPVPIPCLNCRATNLSYNYYRVYHY